MNKLTSILLILLAGIYFDGFAQEADFKKNQITCFSSLYNYLDGMPTFKNVKYNAGFNPNLYNKFRANFGRSIGLSYTRRIDSIRSYKISMESVYINYGNVLKGEVEYRHAYYLDGLRAKRLFERKQYSFDVFYGGGIRIGEEFIYLSSTGIDRNYRYKQLRDLGITIGGTYEHRLYKNISANLQLKYVRYIFRWDRGDKNSSDAISQQGSTPNLLGVSLGIGYSF